MSFNGHSWVQNDGDFFTQYITGPENRPLLKKSGLSGNPYGRYHYREHIYDDQGIDIEWKIINEHPNFDHGFEELHQKMVSFAPQIVEAIKPFCE